VRNESLRTIALIWQVDESQATWLDGGFDWVPGSHLVRVRGVQKGEGNDDDRWRISVQTSFLKSAPLSDEQFLKRMGAVSGLASRARPGASTAAWVRSVWYPRRPGTIVNDHWLSEDERQTLRK